MAAAWGPPYALFHIPRGMLRGRPWRAHAMSGSSMIRAALIILSLSAPRPEVSAQEVIKEASDSPYNVLEQPLSSRQFNYLLKNRYRVEKDGTVWHTAAKTPTSKSEMPYLLQRLEGAEKLRVLFDINGRLNRSNGGNDMSPEEKVELRAIIRENWSLFSFSVRKDFKKYFTVQEIEEMGYEPSAPALPPLPLKHHELEEPIATPRPKLPEVLIPLGITQAAIAPTTAAAVMPPAPKVIPNGVVDKTAAAVMPPADSAIPNVAAAITSSMVMPQAVKANSDVIVDMIAAGTKPQELKKIREDLVDSSTPKITRPTLQPAPPPILPEAQTPPPETTVMPPAPKTSLPAFSPEAFDKFLPEAPYGREVKALLSLIARFAPDKERALALQTVTGTLASIVIDNSRMGLSLRGTSSYNPPAAPQIVLSPGPIIYAQRKLFFEGPESVLPASPEALPLLGLPGTLQAANRNESPVKIEKTDWGETQIFKDGSKRGSFSPQQQAGTLLHELLGLARRLSGEAPTWASSRDALAAQWKFYAKLQEELGSDAFLDPPLRAAYREWREARWDSGDFSAHALPAGSPLEREWTTLPEDSKMVPYTTPSRSFSAQAPAGWLAYEENEPTGAVAHILAPPKTEGAFRAGIDIHWFDSHAPEFIPLKQVMDSLRRKDAATKRTASGLRRLSVDAGLARYFEAGELRYLPLERAPSRQIELHHYLAVIPRGESFFLVRLASDRETYLDHRDTFLSVIKSLK